jgi:hypothetical protein
MIYTPHEPFANTNITSAILINDLCVHITYSIGTRARGGMLRRRSSYSSTPHGGTLNRVPICRLFALQPAQQGRNDLSHPREILVQRVCRGVLAEACFEHGA